MRHLGPVSYTQRHLYATSFIRNVIYTQRHLYNVIYTQRHLYVTSFIRNIVSS